MPAASMSMGLACRCASQHVEDAPSLTRDCVFWIGSLHSKECIPSSLSTPQANHFGTELQDMPGSGKSSLLRQEASILQSTGQASSPQARTSEELPAPVQQKKALRTRTKETLKAGRPVQGLPRPLCSTSTMRLRCCLAPPQLTCQSHMQGVIWSHRCVRA